MAVEIIQRIRAAERACIVRAGLRLRVIEAVDRKAIEAERNGYRGAEQLLQRKRRGVVVVVVGTPAVAAEVVELADGERIDAAVVERVEDGDAVGCQRDGAAAERCLGGDRVLRDCGLQRDLPRVAAGVGLRKRHLLLPCLDAHHHGHLERRMRQAVRFHVEPLCIAARTDEGSERSEGRGLPRAGGRGRVAGTSLGLHGWRNGRLVERADRGKRRLGVRAVFGNKVVHRHADDLAIAEFERHAAGAHRQERCLVALALAGIEPRAERAVRCVRAVGPGRMCHDRHGHDGRCRGAENDGESINCHCWFH